jgi:peptide/nickel transport system ATP-binding protein
MCDVLVKGENLSKVFRSGFLGKKRVLALRNVNIEIRKGETLALVGESGSGKSTLGKVLLMLIKPDSGRVVFDGVDLTRLNGKKLRSYRLKMQLIPQHPDEALDPRWKIYDSIAEPLRIHRLVESKEEERDRVLRMVEIVGLKEEHLNRYPHEVSGGELQRAVIARALMLNPKFIVCDEPTSMLDVSTQASIVRLLLDLQREFGITYLYITHDVELAEVIADRIVVMKNGTVYFKRDQGLLQPS